MKKILYHFLFFGLRLIFRIWKLFFSLNHFNKEMNIKIADKKEIY